MAAVRRYFRIAPLAVLVFIVRVIPSTTQQFGGNFDGNGGNIMQPFNQAQGRFGGQFQPPLQGGGFPSTQPGVTGGGFNSPDLRIPSTAQQFGNFDGNGASIMQPGVTGGGFNNPNARVIPSTAQQFGGNFDGNDGSIVQPGVIGGGFNNPGLRIPSTAQPTGGNFDGNDGSIVQPGGTSGGVNNPDDSSTGVVGGGNIAPATIGSNRGNMLQQPFRPSRRGSGFPRRQPGRTGGGGNGGNPDDGPAVVVGGGKIDPTTLGLPPGTIILGEQEFDSGVSPVDDKGHSAVDNFAPPPLPKGTKISGRIEGDEPDSMQKLISQLKLLTSHAGRNTGTATPTQGPAASGCARDIPSVAAAVTPSSTPDASDSAVSTAQDSLQQALAAQQPAPKA